MGSHSLRWHGGRCPRPRRRRPSGHGGPRHCDSPAAPFQSRRLPRSRDAWYALGCPWGSPFDPHARALGHSRLAERCVARCGPLRHGLALLTRRAANRARCTTRCRCCGRLVACSVHPVRCYRGPALCRVDARWVVLRATVLTPPTASDISDWRTIFRVHGISVEHGGRQESFRVPVTPRPVIERRAVTGPAGHSTGPALRLIGYVACRPPATHSPAARQAPDAPRAA
jgi:hypothetical protein